MGAAFGLVYRSEDLPALVRWLRERYDLCALRCSNSVLFIVILFSECPWTGILDSSFTIASGVHGFLPVRSVFSPIWATYGSYLQAYKTRNSFNQESTKSGVDDLFAHVIIHGEFTTWEQCVESYPNFEMKYDASLNAEGKIIVPKKN